MNSMNEIKSPNLIDVRLFNMCLIGSIQYETFGGFRKYILETYKGRRKGIYYLDKVSNFLKECYGMTLKNYCIQYLKINWPKCPVSGQDVGYNVNGKGIWLSQFKRGKISKQFCPNFALACAKMSKERMGKNNPMYGVPSWNKGKDKRNPIVRLMSEQSKGRTTSLETKQKQSESAKRRLIHGHTGIKHSKKVKSAMRIPTAGLWARGVFNRTTSIHLKVKEFLKTLNLVEQPVEEFQVKYFSMDFAFPTHKVAIEVQGTFFHVDPRIYPNGPINAIQRRNFGRDNAKKKVCCNQEGWKIIEVWETEINDGTFQNFLTNKLKEYKLL